MKLSFYYIFTISESILSYFSGIFTAAAINILTSKIPNSILSIGKSAISFVIVAILFFLSSLLLIAWVTIVNPAKLAFEESKKIVKNQDIKQIWYDILCGYKIQNILVVIFFLLFAFTVASIIILITL